MAGLSNEGDDGSTHLDPAAARCRARPLDALAARRYGAGHRGLFRAAERTRALAGAGRSPRVAASRLRWHRRGARRAPCASGWLPRRSGWGSSPGARRASRPRRSAVPCSALTSRVALPIFSACPRASAWCSRRCGWKGNHVPPAEMMPARLRVSLSRGAPPLTVGDRILVLANLSPPSGPAAPGAFDFQRVARYQQLGAVGYALAPAVVIDHGTAVRLRALHRRAAGRHHRTHPEGAAGTGRRRGRGTADWGADGGRQGYRPGDA